MRGKVPALAASPAGDGITPAYAGKRRSKTSSRAVSKDHPRVCGEKAEWMDDKTAKKGSPPRMRGKVQQHRPYVAPDRITPAYAGKSL